MDASEGLSVVLTAASEVFGRPVRSTDSFFDLGGDSLAAVELTNRLEERLGREIDVVDLLSARSFEDFSEAIS